MSYRILLKRSAEKELGKLPFKIHDRIVEGLQKLEHNPRPEGTKKLRAREDYRIRVGDYRVLYVVNDLAKTVEVFSIAHRGEVYRSY